MALFGDRHNVPVDDVEELLLVSAWVGMAVARGDEAVFFIPDQYVQQGNWTAAALG